MEKASNAALILCLGLVGIPILSDLAGSRLSADVSSGIISVASAAVHESGARAPKKRADTVLDRIGVSRGICVAPGDAKCGLALQLARES